MIFLAVVLITLGAYVGAMLYLFSKGWLFRTGIATLLIGLIPALTYYIDRGQYYGFSFTSIILVPISLGLIAVGIVRAALRRLRGAA